MPVFGKSLFETVLDGLASDAPEDDAFEGFAATPNDKLAASLVSALSEPSNESDSSFSNLYDDFFDLPVPTDQPPDWLGRVSAEEVASDLAIEAEMSERELKERRRSFARLNHPDCVADEFRDQATIRMKIANRLLDEALGLLKT